MADIFVSYTSSDAEWAQWIGVELRALGHVPHIHEWEIQGGASIYRWMESRIDAADHVLCVVSDEYLKAPYSTLEREAAQWQAASQRPGFVLLVVVKPCKLPALSDFSRRCELFGVPEDVARVRFKDFMTHRESAQAAAFPGKVRAVSNVPIRVPAHFAGGEEFLEAIAAALTQPGGGTPVAVLHGLRGVGKTTLAAAYADRHSRDHRATWWVRAQTAATIRAELVALGVRLGWVATDAREEPALADVMERLRHEGEGILLIYDNAVDAATVKPFLPVSGRAEALVTSNAHAWGGVAAPIEIPLWPAEVGAQYLLARTGRPDEREAAAELSEALGRLPLAHAQAGAYCDRLGLSLAEYLSRFAATPGRLLDTVKDAVEEYNGGLTVAKTFALAIDEAAKLHPAADALIQSAAQLAAEPIPLFLLARVKGIFGDGLEAPDGDELDEAVAALRSFALVDREAIRDERAAAVTTDCVRLHLLVRQVAAARAGEAAASMQKALLDGLVDVYPTGVYDDARTWPRARRLDAISLAAVAQDAAIPPGAELAVAKLSNVLAVFRQGPLADYAEAERLYQRALTIREAVLGPDDPLTATSLNNLGLVRQARGDFSGARPLFERALAIRESVLGPEHGLTANSLSCLGFLLQAIGDPAAARPLFERALAIQERSAPMAAATAQALGHLGRLLQELGDTDGALKLLTRAVAVSKTACGEVHPDVANALTGLAVALQSQRDYAGAQPLYQRALEINEAVFGHDHPAVAGSLFRLGLLMKERSELPAARAFYEQALEVQQKKVGPMHIDTATTLHNLAVVLEAQGAIGEARSRYERALSIYAPALGASSKETRTALANLVRLLKAAGESEAADAAQIKYGAAAEVETA